jgi:hypothetical protein
MKPAPAVKERMKAAVGLSGVIGGGAHRQFGRGTWEARRGVGKATTPRGKT